MQGEADDKRNVIPRWRPLRAIEKIDLASIKPASPELFESNLARLKDEITIWTEASELSDGSDLFDAFILTGDRTLLLKALSIFKAHEQAIPPRLMEAIASISHPEKHPLVWRRQIAHLETNEVYVRSSIRALKKHINEYPRDAITHVELARLYTILGIHSKSAQHIYIATTLSPNNRYVLRSMMQFYDTVDDLVQGLKNIRKSSILKFDPWIQSAEVAAATSLGKSSVIASHKLIQVNASGNVTRNSSELAMALATLDRENGVKERKVFKLVKAALPNSTENGFAQAIWLSDRSTREFANRFPDARPSEDAFEARVKLDMKKRNFIDAAKNAEDWLIDQPFSTNAVITYLNICAVHTRPTETSVAHAIKALHTHGDRWDVLNACILTLTEAGDLDHAHQALARMDKLSHSEGIAPYLAAARGFLAYAENDIALGRQSYSDALQHSSRMKNNYLILNASIFWFRAESIKGLLNQKEINDTRTLISDVMKKLNTSERSILSETWHSVERRINEEPSKLNNPEDGTTLPMELANIDTLLIN